MAIFFFFVGLSGGEDMQRQKPTDLQSESFHARVLRRILDYSC